MDYQIAFMSNGCGTSKLVQRMKEVLPEGSTTIVDLNDAAADLDSDVYLIAFDFWRGTPPLKIIDLLVQLEEKQILIFVTSGLAYSEEYQKAVEQKIKPFLPDRCNYCGLFLCPGELPEYIAEQAKGLCEDPVSRDYANLILENHRKTKGHPTEHDIQRMESFIRTHIPL